MELVRPELSLIEADYWRAVMYATLRQQLRDRPISGNGIEFGGSNGVIQGFCPAVEWETRGYPEYDVLDSKVWDGHWDVVVLDMVLEHVPRPWEVFRYLDQHAETAIITVPFLIGIHLCPDDCWRMTPSAIRQLGEPYYSDIDIRTWGNAEVAYLHAAYNDTGTLLKAERRRALGVLMGNDPDKPFDIWAVLRR